MKYKIAVEAIDGEDKGYQREFEVYLDDDKMARALDMLNKNCSAAPICANTTARLVQTLITDTLTHIE